MLNIIIITIPCADNVYYYGFSVFYFVDVDLLVRRWTWLPVIPVYVDPAQLGSDAPFWR